MLLDAWEKTCMGQDVHNACDREQGGLTQIKQGRGTKLRWIIKGKSLLSSSMILETQQACAVQVHYCTLTTTWLSEQRGILHKVWGF